LYGFPAVPQQQNWLQGKIVMGLGLKRLMAIVGICAGLALVAAPIFGIGFSQDSATASNGAKAHIAEAQPPAKLGPSGLPVPRFVSLKRNKVNVRKGPSTDHRVTWIYTSKGYPVEIIAESDNWRRIRDAQGDEGWVFHSLLSGMRTSVVSPWGSATQVPLLVEPLSGATAVASLSSGVMGSIGKCDGQWCMITVPGFSGWVQQDRLWGVYPGEKIE
jgi:SH3-like domain-containing protein